MMKMRQLIAATIVLAALAATLYWSNHRKPANDSVIASPSAANAKIISLNQDDISKLEVKKKDGDDVVLSRVGPSSWKITSPKSLVADQDSVSTILYNLSPMDGATLIDEKAADLKQFGLAEPEAKVSATGKDGKTQTILVGDETPTGDSAYVMVSGDSKVYSVPKNTKANLDKGLKDLRDKRLMPVDFDKLASVEISGAKLRLTFASDDGQWTVRSPANLRGDTSKMETIIEKLRTATMDPSAPDAETKKAAFLFASGAPIASLKATDASGSQELQIRKAADGYYAKTTAMDGVYKVSGAARRIKRIFPDARRRGLVVGRKKDGRSQCSGILALDSHADGDKICDGWIFQRGTVPGGDLQGRQARRKSGHFKKRKRLPREKSGWSGAFCIGRETGRGYSKSRGRFEACRDSPS